MIRTYPILYMARLDSLQEHLDFTADQETRILDSYRVMHSMLTRCAEERNNIIFPDIQKTLNLFPKVAIFLMPHSKLKKPSRRTNCSALQKLQRFVN